MAKEKSDTLRFTMVIACLLGGLIFAYYYLGWDTGAKIDNATYAKITLAESGPYALNVTLTEGISGEERHLVEEELVKFFDEKGFEFVDATDAVNDGGSVLTVHLDSTSIEPGKRTFSVDLQVTAYVFRRTASDTYYMQAAHIFASGKHGHATDDVFDEAISTTALNMVKEFHDQYQKDNP